MKKLFVTNFQPNKNSIFEINNRKVDRRVFNSELIVCD